jgi:hypothetical protein
MHIYCLITPGREWRPRKIGCRRSLRDSGDRVPRRALCPAGEMPQFGWRFRSVRATNSTMWIVGRRNPRTASSSLSTAQRCHQEADERKRETTYRPSAVGLFTPARDLPPQSNSNHLCCSFPLITWCADAPVPHTFVRTFTRAVVMHFAAAALALIAMLGAILAAPAGVSTWFDEVKPESHSLTSGRPYSV